MPVFYYSLHASHHWHQWRLQAESSNMSVFYYSPLVSPCSGMPWQSVIFEESSQNAMETKVCGIELF